MSDDSDIVGTQPDPGTTGMEVTSATGFSRTSSGAVGPSGLVPLPPVEPDDPRAALLQNPLVPPNKRVCRCGRSLANADPVTGAPVTEGVCEDCGRPFSFTPRLKPGDLVGGQYQVEGCIAHGGLGWIYLARDRNLDNSWVVLKGLLDEEDPTASAAAIAERRFLIEVKHPNIVQIRNFVSQDAAGYIVMEYLAGKSLRELRERDGNRLIIPVERAVEFILAVLPAFEYLHSIGLLYCDFKPDNVINTVNAVKLIDLGSVYQVGGSAMTFGTVGYQAPEVEERGPSVASDLYTIARTLAVLCVDFPRRTTDLSYGVPDPADVPLFQQFDSLYRFLRKGTATDPADRFSSAAEMRLQLALIQHEIVAVQRGKVRVPHSELFGDEPEAGTEAVDPKALPALRDHDDDPLDTSVRAIQVLLDAGQVDEASDLCDSLGQEAPRDWRVSWLRGVAALMSGKFDRARACFDRVYSAVPGELAPKLALGFAAEAAGDQPTAARLYDTVSRTAPNLTSAAFGLARTAQACGDHAAAVAAYERVSRSASSWSAARIARAGLLLAGANGGGPGWAELQEAARTVALRELTAAQATALRREVLEQALAHRPDAEPNATLFGCRLEETDLRLGLERCYRELARYASSWAERIALVDAANDVRPRTWV